MSLIPVNSHVKTFSNELPKQTKGQLKNLLIWLLKELDIEKQKNSSKKQNKRPEYQAKVRDTFLDKYKKLPELLTGTISFLSLDDFEISILNINAEFSELLKRMTLKEKTELLNDALKHYNFDYYKALNLESDAAASQPKPKKAAAKSHSHAQKILKNKTKFTTLEEGVNTLLTSLDKETAHSTQEKTLEQFLNTFGTLARSLKTPDETAPERDAPNSFKENLYLVKRQFGKEIAALDESALTSLLHHCLGNIFPGYSDAMEAEKIDALTKWCRLFDDLIASNNPELIENSLLDWFKDIESDEELRMSVKTWEKSLRCIVKLADLPTSHVLTPLSELQKHFLNDTFSQLMELKEHAAIKDFEAIKAVLNFTFKLLIEEDEENDLNYTNRYFSFLAVNPDLFDTSLYSQTLLKFACYLIEKNDRNSRLIAMKILSLAPVKLSDADQILTLKLVRKLVSSYLFHKMGDEEIESHIAGIIEHLRFSDNYIQDLTTLSVAQSTIISDKVIKCCLDYMEGLRKEKKTPIDRLLNAYEAVEDCLSSVLPVCSKPAFACHLKKMERIIEDLKRYQLNFSELLIEILQKIVAFNSPENYPKDPFEPFRGLLKIIGPNHENFVDLISCMSTYILVKTDVTRPDIETTMKNLINQLVEIVHPGISKIKQPKKAQEISKNSMIISLLTIILNHGLKVPSASLHYLKVALDLYREWTNKETIAPENLYRLLVVPAFRCFNSASNKLKPAVPNLQIGNHKLLEVWKDMVKSFILHENANKILDELLDAEALLGREVDAVFDFSADQYHDAYIVPIESPSFKIPPVDNSSGLGIFKEPFAIFKLIWEVGSPTDRTKIQVWQSMFDLYLKYIDRIFKEFPEGSVKEREAHLKQANKLIHEISHVVEAEIKTALLLSNCFSKERLLRIAKIYKDLLPLENMIKQLDEASRHPGAPVLAIGDMPFRYALSLFTNVISSPLEKQTILKSILDYAARHWKFFEKDHTALSNLLHCANAAFIEGTNEHFVYDGEDGEMKIFNMKNLASPEIALPDPSKHQNAQDSLSFTINYLTSSCGENGLMLAKIIENFKNQGN